MRDAVLTTDELNELVDALDRCGPAGNCTRYRRRSDELVSRSHLLINPAEFGGAAASADNTRLHHRINLGGQREIRLHGFTD